jgi:uncharacterized membrane protein SirB2
MKKLLAILFITVVFVSCKKEPFELQWTQIETNSKSFFYTIAPVSNDTLYVFGGINYLRTELLSSAIP